MYKIIIDANVWIKYARAKNIAPLLKRFIDYHLVPIVNNYLLSEIFEALVNNKWLHASDAYKLLAYISKISITKTETAMYQLCLDPKDNYLFDLAIQNNCLFIITDDSKLLCQKFPQFYIHSTSWFLKKFPL
ncbi:putative toxin-antitoxin system toxin component, PIN family [Niabella ginsengisoli]|uniref:Toxin-antitoxin system toxin component, PIN family n=1 Tax=Niabella ginsengisoli TaxID=522298 RepID=A0ABS9SPZ7_9BACT|nr:putative toxin-antitoxin system toxin component, PIN family [Niabella ginsengisoli]MCH5600445.1 putative toxin-antitoxin system toxin component, PIN family [Niabella ginsengisoli]